MNVWAADKHVPDVKRFIKTTIEWTRTLLHNLPYNVLHCQLVASAFKVKPKLSIILQRWMLIKYSKPINVNRGGNPSRF